MNADCVDTSSDPMITQSAESVNGQWCLNAVVHVVRSVDRWIGKISTTIPDTRAEYARELFPGILPLQKGYRDRVRSRRRRQIGKEQDD